tara:strand:+ start:1084 stop:1689 length:606 start_codon:yes stop_codon:yes gene_type:complete
MCVEPTTAILIATAVSAGAQYQQGRMQASIARRNNELMKAEIVRQNAQLEEEKKIAKINAFEEEEQRKDLLRKTVATQRAYNRGLENKSFLALIDYEREALAKDIANIRLGTGVETSRLASAISVNNIRAQTPDLSSFYTKSGTLAAVGTAATGYANYSMVKSGNPGGNNTATASTTNSAYTKSYNTSSGPVSAPSYYGGF